MSRQIQDGCPEYDERLMDLTVQPIADPLLEAHLAICDRCRYAHEQYLETARVVGAAFTVGPQPLQQRRQSLRPVHALAAAILTAAGVLLASFFHRAEELSSLSVHPEEGTVVRLLGPSRAVIESGTSTFVIRDPEMVVETPAGLISCDSSCEFTVHVEQCEACAPVLRYACDPAPMCVTLFVAAGLVGGDFEDLRTAMGPGETLTWSIPGSPLLGFGPTP